MLWETYESFQTSKVVKSLQYFPYTFMNGKISHMTQLISLSTFMKQKFLPFILTLGEAGRWGGDEHVLLRQPEPDQVADGHLALR